MPRPGEQTLHHNNLNWLFELAVRLQNISVCQRGNKVNKKFIWSALSVGMIALLATMVPDIKRYIRISTM